MIIGFLWYFYCWQALLCWVHFDVVNCESIMILLLLVFWYCLMYSQAWTQLTSVQLYSPQASPSPLSCLPIQIYQGRATPALTERDFGFLQTRNGILFLSSSCSTVRQSLYSPQSWGWGWTPVSSWLLVLTDLSIISEPLSVLLEASCSSSKNNKYSTWIVQSVSSIILV